ncbi:MAG TPA: porin family protein [Rhizobiales bacterium]|nr:porin family protein [Hyphomicrobiales bacterium]
MYRFARKAFLAALVASTAGSAFAADLYEPPVIETTPPPVYEEVSYGGWYIRGDLDYHASRYHKGDYITYGPPAGTGAFDFGKLRSTFSLGGGIGYQVNRYFRTDVTLDYMFKSKFRGQTTGTAGSCGQPDCVSVDESAYSALLMMANAYADLGTYHGITPYVGAGIGGAYLKWDDLRNTVGGVTTVHRGTQNWRFAYALMAGASYCLTDKLKLDVGYRYAKISGGRQFEYAPAAGPGFDRGISIHEGRAGLRYQFSGRSECYEPEPIAYEPPPAPVYK